MIQSRGTSIFSSRGIIVIAIIVGLAAGYGLGYAQLQPRVEDLRANLAKTEDRLSVTQANLDKTQMLLSATKTNLTRSETELKNTLQSLQSTKEELSTTQANLKSTTDQLNRLTSTLNQVKKIVTNMDADRLLLIELRTEPPDTRVGARASWTNVKRLAVNADPALGPSVDKILAQIDAYFNWLDAMPSLNATSDKILKWLIDDYYDVYFAYRYDEAIAIFKDEVTRMVITHIDMANDLIS